MSSSPDRRRSRRPALATVLAAVALTAMVPAPGQAQELETPKSWRWVTDRPVRLVTTQSPPDSAWRFVAMPPGWHITTKPAATLYDPANRAEGVFALESRLVLFPTKSDSGYGIFIGGREVESRAPTWLALLIRLDGQAAVEVRRDGVSTLAQPWTANTAVKPYPGRGVVTNVVKISADADSLVFSANDQRLFALPRAGLPTDGHFGFRIGEAVDLHITTLDHTRRLAPLPK